MTLRSLILVLLLSLSGLASAGMHKCKDANGKVFYQDHRCAQGKTAASFNASAVSGASASGALADRALIAKRTRSGKQRVHPH